MMSTKTAQITSPNNHPMDGSAPFTHPETPHLRQNLTYLDRLTLYELMAEGIRLQSLTEDEVANFFVGEDGKMNSKNCDEAFMAMLEAEELEQEQRKMKSTAARDLAKKWYCWIKY